MAISVATTLLLAVLIAGCATGGDLPAASTSALRNSETPEQAAARLFATAYAFHMGSTAYPRVLEGATVGRAQAAARDYDHPGPIIASWILDYDPEAAGGLFEQMRPLEMTEGYYIVPMIKDGRSVDEFDLFLDDTGEWGTSWGPLDPLPGGLIHDVEEATVVLEWELGQEAQVRVTLFWPTGLVFAVGRQDRREEAVYLTFVNDGPGHTPDNVLLPEDGQLFTPDQLRAFLWPYS